MASSAESTQNPQTSYRVLARKYRPQNFDELIGQDALVKTLKNAIETGRIAHAFMLTGVRGVGKTTTARIIAKALNYTGADGTKGPTSGNTDDCAVCKAISEDRHPDVMEMDAASRTGVDDIREILDGVRYAPTSARYKIYIIDEVHMLSKNAFNALLKTLEEPPPHVKFIFATTEIRKVPVTVLSRCQRFDLKRVELDVLKTHFSWVSQQEGAKIEDEALNLIARAADGSVRDGLSLLDQAISMTSGNVLAINVKSMLGLADRSKILDLYGFIANGKAAESLDILKDLYAAGADPASLVQDLLDLTHLMTKFKAIQSPPQTVEPAMAAEERAKAATLAAALPMSILGRFWSLLLKSMAEVQAAPNGQSALEMGVLRLIFAADLPDPATVLKTAKDEITVAKNAQKTGSAGGNSGGGFSNNYVQHSVNASAQGVQHKIETHVQQNPQIAVNNNLETLDDLIALLEQNGAMILAATAAQYMHVLGIQNNQIEVALAKNAPANLAPDLTKKLQTLTGARWMVSITKLTPEIAEQYPTKLQKEQNAAKALLAEIAADPLVKEVQQIFSGAEIIEFKKL